MRNMLENASHMSRDKNKNAREDAEMIRDKPSSKAQAQILILDHGRVISLLLQHGTTHREDKSLQVLLRTHM